MTPRLSDHISIFGLVFFVLRDGPLENLWGGGGAGEVQKKKIRAREN